MHDRNVRDLHGARLQIERRLQQLHDIAGCEPSSEIKRSIEALWETAGETERQMGALFGRA
ncbi:MAG: hypothetical protein ACE363_04560 [Alphaproteobacteria bacterium]